MFPQPYVPTFKSFFFKISSYVPKFHWHRWILPHLSQKHLVEIELGLPLTLSVCYAFHQILTEKIHINLL